MTTYTRSVTAAFGGTTITQNVNTTDTVEVTVTMPGNILVSTITASNCSRTPASMSSGSTCTVTFSGTGSYSVVFTGSTGGKYPVFYQATLNGTVSSASVTAPTASNVIITGESTAQANTTATVNLSASGSGGTLQYACEVGDSTPDNWQTSNVFNNISRGSGTVYARARRSATALSNVVNNNQADFLVGDSVFSRTSPTIAHNASSATTEVGSPSGPAGSGETIAVRVDGGSTNLATGLVDSNGEVDIAFSSSLPSAGNSETYRLFVRRPTNTGGDGSTFNSTGMTFTVTRGSVPTTDAPTNLTFSTAATASSSTSVTVTASGGGTGTLKVSADGTNWYANGTSFGSRTRGTAHTWYARVEGTPNSSNYTEAHTPPYLAPDASISAISSPDLAYGSTTHVVAIAGGNASDQYYVYNNAGSTSYGGRTGNGNITITHGVAAGGAATFRVYARKPLNVGGDNAFDNTGTTFEVEVYPNSTSLSVSNNNAAAASVTVTLSATGGQGGTIEYAKTSYSGTTTYAQNRGTTVTYYSRSVAGNGLISSVSSVNHTVGYIAPAGGTPGSPNIFTGGTSHTASISGGTAGTVYEFRSGGYTGTILNTVDGNGTAACSGGAGTYYVTRYKTTATGGSGTTGRTNLATYTVTAISKQTFTIRINYIPGEPGTDPFIQAPTETVDVGSITGSVTSSSGPLEVSVGDDVIWKSGNGQDAVKITSLNDFTNNTDITLTTTTGVTRTLANGVNGTDVIDIEVDAGSDGSATTAYRIKRVGGITSPSGLSSSLSGTESQTETVTLSLSTSGSGGTLEYIQRTTASLLGAPASDWQTSAQFTQPRNTTRYYYASRNRLDGASTSVLTVTVNYLGAVTTGYSFDTASGNIGYGDGAPAISFTAAQANHTVAIFEGSTARSSGVTGATDHNNIATNQIPPAGGSNTYNLRTYRNQDAGGNPSLAYVATNASTITIKRYPQTPSGLTTFTDGGTAAAAGTFTIAVGNLDGASSTTITLSSNYTTNAVANGSAIANVVRAGDVIYARNTGSNGLTADAAISTPATYLDPDLSVTASNVSITNTATSASTTIGGMTAGQTVAIRLNNGTTNLATRVGNGALSFTSNLPTYGNSTTYELFTSRPTTAGGSAAFFATDDTFTVTRAAANSAPTAFDFTNQSGVAIDGAERESANTVTIAGLSSGTSLSVSVSGGTYSKNGGAYTSANTTTVNGDTFKLKHNSSTSYSTSTTTTLTVGTGSGSFISTTLPADTTPSDFDFTNQTNVPLTSQRTSANTVTIAGLSAGTSTSVSVSGGTYSKNGGAYTSANTTTVNGDTFKLRHTSSGSNSTSTTTTLTVGGVAGSFVSTTVAATIAPTLSNVIITGESTAQANTTATVNLATNGSGSEGTLQYACEVGDSTPDNWQTSNVFTNISRGSGTVYARARRSATALSNVVTASQADFLIGDSVFSRTSPTIAHNDSSATTEVGSPSGPATAGETIAVRVDGGSTNLATGLVGSNGEVDITFSSSLPSAGNSETYRLFVRRPTNTGGDGSTFNSTGMTFTVTRSSAPVASYTVTAPTSIDEGSSGTINIATSNVATDTEIFWAITPSALVSGSSTGSEDTDSSGNASFSITASTVTGSQTGTVKLRTGSQSGTVVASDTFLVNDESAAYSVSPSAASINEGSSLTINIATTNVATNTELFWAVTSTGQFTGDTSGSEDTDSSGNASFSVTPTADSTTEGALTVYVYVRIGGQTGTVVASSSFVVNDTSTGSSSADYGVVITNKDNQSILDTRTDKQSTLLKSGTKSISPSTNQIVTNTVYVNPENAPSDVVNFGAPNTNSFTVWKATSSGTLSGAGKVGLLQTVAVTGVTAASANANETGVIIVGSPGGNSFAFYSFQPNASTDLADNNIAFTSFYTVSKSVTYMAVKY